MKVIKRILKWLIVVVLGLSLIYFLGPKPESPELSRSITPISVSLNNLDSFVEQSESVTNLKDNNQARIIWADNTLSKTEYSVVYLHGFSASQGEGFPLHQDFAKRYGCNLYLARLAGHGIANQNAMKGLNAAHLMKSARDAIAIGQLLGDKVIVMGTSTGSTLALYLAGGKNEIHALIMYSPNIAVNDKSANLLTGPWGYQLAEYVAGGEVIDWGSSSGFDSLYWNTSYHIDGLIAMQDLIDQTMNKQTFQAVKQPVFMGYYFKNEEEQDQIVSVPEMLNMFDLLGTPQEKKVREAFPGAGHHVIASSYKSRDVESVKKSTYQFAEEVLHLKPIE